MKPEVRMTVFLMITTTICTLLLAGANFAYRKASFIFNIRLYKTILELFEIPAAEDSVEAVFDEHFETIQSGGTTYYRAKTKRPGTIVFKSEGSGLWSRIELLLAVNPNRESLFGMRVLSQAETPGLGGRIAEPDFQKQFKGIEVRPKLGVVKFAIAGNQVDAVSGATKTSDAVEFIVNSGIEGMDRVFGKEGQDG